MSKEIIGKKILIKDTDLFIKQYHELKSSRKLAELYNVDKGTILKYLRVLGINTTRKIILSDEQIKEICDSYYTCSSSKLAEKYNVKKSMIGSIWFKNGLKGKYKRVYSIDENCLSDIDTELKAYFLGLFAADGCLYKTKEDGKQNIIRISLQKDDEGILISFKDNLFKTEKPITYHHNYASLEISSDKIVNKLLEYGFDERKTYKNVIPDNIPDYLVPHFIRGFFDGDGCISKKSKGLHDISIGITGYKNNLDKIANFLNKVNIFSNFNEDRREYTANIFNAPFGNLCISNKINKYAFLKYIYNNSNYYLKRKYNLSKNFTNEIEKINRPGDNNIIVYYKYAVCKAI